MKIDISKLAKSSRPQDMNGTLQVLRHNYNIFASWGGHNFQNHANKVLKFKVNGNHHKGHVYLTINGADLYDVCLTTTHGNIVKEMKNIYFDDLVERIDVAIERVDTYVF